MSHTPIDLSSSSSTLHSCSSTRLKTQRRFSRRSATPKSREFIAELFLTTDPQEEQLPPLIHLKSNQPFVCSWKDFLPLGVTTTFTRLSKALVRFSPAKSRLMPTTNPVLMASSNLKLLRQLERPSRRWMAKSSTSRRRLRVINLQTLKRRRTACAHCLWPSMFPSKIEVDHFKSSALQIFTSKTFLTESSVMTTSEKFSCNMEKSWVLSSWRTKIKCPKASDSCVSWTAKMPKKPLTTSVSKKVKRTTQKVKKILIKKPNCMFVKQKRRNKES